MSERKELPTVGGKGAEVRAERCETCRFNDGERGYCHRFPPVRSADPHPVAHGDTDGWCWPITIPEDWCGEWKAKASMPPSSPIKNDFALAVKTLSPKSQLVISLRFGLVCDANPDGRTHTLPEVAKASGLVRQRVRDVETRALEALKTNFPGLVIPKNA